jgi:NAD(P)-dependent dehydrogenase (short-subunit alcohol dehydrogenase family)
VAERASDSASPSDFSKKARGWRSSSGRSLKIATCASRPCSSRPTWTRSEEINKAVDSVFKQFGSLDILVNNAGIMFEKTVEEMSEADWDRMMAINLKAPFLLTKRAMPFLRRNHRGSIINIGSIEGLASNPGHPAYSASKAGIHGITRTIHHTALRPEFSREASTAH